MKLYIIRHADPDYSIDSLTEKGWREAELLGRRLAKIPAAACYVSPYGRAKDTASLTLKRTGAAAQECPWLREFAGALAHRPEGKRESIPWDFLPRDWQEERMSYDEEQWMHAPLLADSDIPEEYARVCNGLDALLEKHGYRRQGHGYLAVQPNEDSILLFCHFGVECVLLSHLCGIPATVLWHHFVALPSSVTLLVTEERRPGEAIWRLQRFGDLSHLDEAGEEPAFAARFCETYANQQQRHD